jgi:hypothetical protein
MEGRVFALGLLSTLLGAHRSGLGDGGHEPGRRRAGPGAVRYLRAAHPGLARPLGVSGSRQAGFRAAGPHFYTWQEERREAEAWAAELAPLEDDPKSGGSS